MKNFVGSGFLHPQAVRALSRLQVYGYNFAKVPWSISVPFQSLSHCSGFELLKIVQSLFWIIVDACWCHHCPLRLWLIPCTLGMQQSDVAFTLCWSIKRFYGMTSHQTRSWKKFLGPHWTQWKSLGNLQTRALFTFIEFKFVSLFLTIIWSLGILGGYF